VAAPCTTPQTVVPGLPNPQEVRLGGGSVFFTYTRINGVVSIASCKLPGPCATPAAPFERTAIGSLTSTQTGIVFIADRTVYRWDATAPMPVVFTTTAVEDLGSHGDRVFAGDVPAIIRSWPLSAPADPIIHYVGDPIQVKLGAITADVTDIYFTDGSNILRVPR
jgi:hypothetical protein